MASTKVQFPAGLCDVVVTHADDEQVTYRAGPGGWADVDDRDLGSVGQAVAAHQALTGTAPAATKEK